MTGKQLRFLRSLGHHLEPCLIMGKQGLTPNVVKQLLQSIKAHELVKVKIPQSEGPERHELAEALAGATQAALVQVLGRTVLLYRRNRDKPKIELPASKRSNPAE